MPDRLKKLENIIKDFACTCPVDTCNGGDSTKAAWCEVRRVRRSRLRIDLEMGRLTPEEVQAAVHLARRYIQRDTALAPEYVKEMTAAVREHPEAMADDSLADHPELAKKLGDIVRKHTT